MKDAYGKPFFKKCISDFGWIASTETNCQVLIKIYSEVLASRIMRLTD
jgi:hypothetical protein